MLRLLFRKKENELEVSVEEGMEVFADADLISQVLVNLLQNANTHTQGGRIEVRAFLKDGKYQVEITDNGSGIAPELLPHVFVGVFPMEAPDLDCF